MPFTATYNLKLDAAGDTFPIPNLYFRVDGSSIVGGEDNGWTGMVRIYKDQPTCDADIGDDMPFARFSVQYPYVPGDDPYVDLDAAAMALFPDAVTAADTSTAIANNQAALNAKQLGTLNTSNPKIP